MCHWVAGAQPECTVIMSLHYHYLVVAWVLDAARGCCITIIWLLLNSHMQVGDRLPPPGGWGHIPVWCRKVTAYHYLAVAVKGRCITTIWCCSDFMYK